MAITVTQLTSFLAVVRGGSVTAAADALYVTQPSVSSAIAALSRELGVELFERAGRSVRLTAAGTAFAAYAADVLGLLDEGRQAARAAAGEAERELRIAAVTTAAESFVPPLMRAYAARRADVPLVLDVGNRSVVLDAVLDHRADVAFAGQPPGDPRLEALPLFVNEIVLIVAPDDALAGEEAVSASELAGRTWLLRESGSGTRTLNERFLDAVGLRPRTLTLGSNGAIKQAVRAGLGISLLSRSAADAELGSGLLAAVALEQGPAPRRWYALRSAVGTPNPVVLDFFAFLAERADGA